MLKKQFREIMNTKYKGMKSICVFDRIMRQDGLPEELLRMLQHDIETEIIPLDVTVICSGNFGDYVKKVFSPRFGVIHVEGGLRHKDSKIPDLSWHGRLHECVFVDDSIYTGWTQRRVVEAVAKQGGEVVGAYYCFVGGNSPWVRYIKGILTLDEMRRDKDGS